ncbi:MAG: sugar transferase, partial [Stellaceae bacterium]
AQVNNSRGQIDSLAAARRRVALDLYYIDNWSLWLDLKILFMTARVALSRENAY